jgi:hypothetical protein
MVCVRLERTESLSIIAKKIPGSWLVQIRDAGHQFRGQYPDKINKIPQTFLSATIQDNQTFQRLTTKSLLYGIERIFSIS